jgi:hypothetical protein
MLDAKWHSRREIDSLDLDITPHLALLLSSVELPPELDIINWETALATLRSMEPLKSRMEWVQRIVAGLQATMQSLRYLGTTE